MSNISKKEKYKKDKLKCKNCDGTLPNEKQYSKHIQTCLEYLSNNEEENETKDEKEQNSLDQFYTRKEIAEDCWNKVEEKVDIHPFDYFLEPSAGKGAFFKILPEDRRIGIDLEPKFQGITQGDFFAFKPERGKSYLVIGNPPFGRVSSLAIRFFNYAAKFADVIAFIIPRTFKRVSVQNKLDLSFHLLYNQDLPLKPCCFEPRMNAKCCFQIWERRKEKREIIKYATTHPDFNFISLGPKDQRGQPTPPEGAHFALKAYGSNCGEIVEEDLMGLRPKSWHFIRSNIDPEELKNRFNSLDYSLSQDTVRQDSLGRGELVLLYKQKYND